jgi:ankyrin repeat protein
MLAHGANPNVPDAHGWTAAHQAASRGNARLMRAVLEAGADRNRRDRTLRTPLDVVRILKRDKLAALLVATP